MRADDTSVQAFHQQVEAAWKTNDGAAFADLFTVDGSLINPFGERADGRDQLRAMYTGYFAGMLGGTTTTVTATNVRPVGSDHAFVDADQSILAPDGSVVLAVHVVNLLVRDGDGWRMVDSRPYAYATPPA